MSEPRFTEGPWRVDGMLIKSSKPFENPWRGYRVLATVSGSVSNEQACADRDLMAVMPCVHRTHNANVVNNVGQMG